MCREGIIVCNQCGKKLTQKKGMLYEDCLTVQKRWGYFSTQDGLEEQFHLCEECYKELIRGFRIPVRSKRIREYL